MLKAQLKAKSDPITPWIKSLHDDKSFSSVCTVDLSFFQNK